MGIADGHGHHLHASVSSSGRGQAQRHDAPTTHPPGSDERGTCGEFHPPHVRPHIPHAAGTRTRHVQFHLVSGDLHPERTVAYAPFASQVHARNPQPVAAALELPSVGVEHAQPGRRIMRSTLHHDEAVRSGAAMPVAHAPDQKRREQRPVPFVQHQVVVPVAVRLEEARQDPDGLTATFRNLLSSSTVTAGPADRKGRRRGGK